MKRADITDEQVVAAAVESRRSPFDGRFTLACLVESTGAPDKVAYAAMERALHRGYIEFGVSLRTAWAAPQGLALLRTSQGAGS